MEDGFAAGLVDVDAAGSGEVDGSDGIADGWSGGDVLGVVGAADLPHRAAAEGRQRPQA